MSSNQPYDITVKNIFSETGWSVKVFHHFANKEHTISNQKEKKITLGGEQDYLLIQVDHASGPLPQCWVELFSGQAELAFIPAKKSDVAISHTKEKTILRIPAVDFKWEIKVTAPEGTGPGSFESQNVTLGDDKPGIDD